MNYTQDISQALADAVGADGADKKDFKQAMEKAKKAVSVLSGHWTTNAWPVLGVSSRTNDLPLIEEAAQYIGKHFDTLVVLGMGASGRGGHTLVSLAQNQFTGLSGKTAIHFIDNIDPHTFSQMLESINLTKTMFLAISKSGGTAETMAQLLVLLQAMEEKRGVEGIRKHFIFITEPNDNPMRRIGNAYGIPQLEHDPDIGGRYAALTAVGLLPAKVAGLDIRAIRKGADEVIEHTFSSSEPEPAKGAALQYALHKKGKTVSVMMPYCDRLNAFSAWHQQLWAESLGKGGYGTTALRALGAFDQHSQMQLYLDGPKDKFLTLMLLDQQKKGYSIPPSQESSLSYLLNHTIGDLMDAEQRATAKTLTGNKRPIRTFSLAKLDEQTIGALMMHFMLETMIMGQLWGIDPFGQPAVEEGKQLAREYLSNA